MDNLITKLPFFTPDHRNLAKDLLEFVQSEIEPSANEEGDVEKQARHFVEVLARAGVLEHAVASKTELGCSSAVPDS